MSFHQGRQRQRLRHELRILLVEQGKISVPHVQQITTIPRRPLQNHNLKLPQFWFGAKLQNIFIFVLFECVYTL